VAWANPTIWATGTHAAYQWLTTGQDHLDDLLLACPQAVLDKYIAVTSLDSGPLTPTDEEISDGWQSREEIAYSPKIQSVEKLAHGECAGYDEWYVFETPTDLGKVFEGNIFEAPLHPGIVATFVNFGGFGFHDPGMKALVDLFWKQLDYICPESYIADGNVLNFVTRDNSLFAVVLRALAGNPS
jgi:hypothetical protein